MWGPGRGGDRSIISQSIFGKERGIGDTFARLESVSRGPYYSMGKRKKGLPALPYLSIGRLRITNIIFIPVVCLCVGHRFSRGRHRPIY